MLAPILSVTLLGLTAASPLPDLIARQTSCPAYTIIDTRGTGEKQGPSVGFITMNHNILAAKPGGVVYNTVYNADATQLSYFGTQDILREIDATLASDPNHCFFLEGYSQGAATTVDALNQISASSARFNAVKGVFLIGSPRRKPGLACNVDMQGGDNTKNSIGIEITAPGIPSWFISKTLDVCNTHDIFCDTTNVAVEVNLPDGQVTTGIDAHLAYPDSASTQQQGTDLGLQSLNGA